MSATKKTAPEVGGLAQHRSLGHVLFPLRRHSPDSKKPRDAGFLQRDYSDFDAEAHLGGANVGVRLRNVDLVVDVDPRNMPDGQDTFAELCDAIGADLSDASVYPTVVTGGGGRHVYLRKPDELAVVDSLRGFPGVEFKTVGRYVVAAGSVHPETGRLYAWADDTEVFAPSTPEAPTALLDLVRRRPVAANVNAEPGVYDAEELARALSALDPTDFRDQGDWLQLMQACHHATNGTALEEFAAWSTSDPAYADHGARIAARWNSLSTAPAGGAVVTYRTLEKLLLDAGREDAVPRVAPEDDFPDDLEPLPGSTELQLTKGGQARDTFVNALAAVRASGIAPSFNELKQQVSFRAPTLPWPEAYGRTLDEQTLRLVRHLLVEANRATDYQPTKDNVWEAVNTLAYEAKFNPILDYLDALEWDGTPRVERLFPDYFRTADDEYTGAVGRCLMVAAVRRQRRPGCKFDTMPILRGRQGCGKSTGVKALFGDDFFSEATLGELRNKDAAMLLRGIWVQEMAELEGMRRTEANTLKAFLSTSEDRYRPPYAKDVVDYPRRCVFFGTTNEGGYLKDATGARRFWPLEVSPGAEVDVDAIRRDRDQLWAEAAHLEAEGASVVLDRGLWTLAAERQADETSDDPWAEDIVSLLQARRSAFESYDEETDLTVPPPPDRVHATELMQLLGLPATARSKDARQRIKTIMTETLGWTYHKNVRVGSVQGAGYRAPEDDPLA